MLEYIIYNHGGSGNHGCEALVRTVAGLLQKVTAIYSEAPDQDRKYGVDKLAAVWPACSSYSKVSADFLKAYLNLKIKGDYFGMDILPYRAAIQKMPSNAVEISIGGDIYCYEDYPKFIRLHRMIAAGHKSVLVGCSLEKELFADPAFVEDMKTYDLITARESLTYQFLLDAGIKNVKLIPDSAFTLPKEMLPFPDGFHTENVVGINISPLVLRKEKQSGIVLENFTRLMRYILDQTDYTIALIPHVVWDDNDDRSALRQLADSFGVNERIAVIDDCNCMQLKGFISRCRFFIGARTHATIAAYSTGVPTLVLGYSVKSRGIATDLFGTDENYVVPVQSIDHPDRIRQAFCWLQEHEAEIRKHLEHIMPDYMQKAYALTEAINTI